MLKKQRMTHTLKSRSFVPDAPQSPPIVSHEELDQHMLRPPSFGDFQRKPFKVISLGNARKGDILFVKVAGGTDITSNYGGVIGVPGYDFFMGEARVHKSWGMKQKLDDVLAYSKFPKANNPCRLIQVHDSGEVVQTIHVATIGVGGVQKSVRDELVTNKIIYFKFLDENKKPIDEERFAYANNHCGSMDDGHEVPPNSGVKEGAKLIQIEGCMGVRLNSYREPAGAGQAYVSGRLSGGSYRKRRTSRKSKRRSYKKKRTGKRKVSRKKRRYTKRR